MEHSMSAFTYKGSIPESIIEAKTQKKLFVVYISGEDAVSTELEKSTWPQPKVAESLLKYCIFLHMLEGSTDAANFCAIYPQKSIPSIAAIGHNGVQLWQSEGFVSAEDLASSLEKAWMSLHIKETTATFLTAALASKKPELSSAVSPDVGSSGQGSSSDVDPSSLLQSHVCSLGTKQSSAAEMIEENLSQEHKIEEKISKLDDDTSSKSSVVHQSCSDGVQQSTSLTGETKGSSSPLVVDSGNCVDDHLFSDAEDGYSAQEKIINHHKSVPAEDLQLVTKRNEDIIDEKAESMDDVKANILDNNTGVKELSDVQLSIRLPSGINLQERFLLTNTLRMVKDYVDGKEASIGSYDLAIPYPRKVFSDKDLSKSLLELGLLNRQALLVVPHQKFRNYHTGDSSSDRMTSKTNTDSSNTNDGGYFAHIRRILSYVNPLSYIGGNATLSNSGQAQTDTWRYSPNPTLDNSSSSTERTSATSRNGKGKQPTTARFGSNIHTLKHDEDDGPVGDRNRFWNGNSTQYGGNNDDK